MFLDAAALIEQDDTGDAKEPRLAGSLGGNAVAVWLQWDGDRHNVWANIYDVGAGWRAAQAIEDRSGEAEAPHVAMSPAGGTAIAVWSQPDDGTLVRVWAKRYEMGWGEPEPLEADTGVPSMPEVAMDPAGNAVAVWVQRDGTTQNLMAKRYEYAGGWQAAEAIDQGDGDASRPHVAMDPTGNAMAVWQQSDRFQSNIWSRHYDAGTRRWGEAELVETRDGTASAPRVSMDAEGNAIAVWYQWDETLSHNDIWANRWAPAQ